MTAYAPQLRDDELHITPVENGFRIDVIPSLKLRHDDSRTFVAVSVTDLCENVLPVILGPDDPSQHKATVEAAADQPTPMQHRVKAGLMKAADIAEAKEIVVQRARNLLVADASTAATTRTILAIAIDHYDNLRKFPQVRAGHDAERETEPDLRTPPASDA